LPKGLLFAKDLAMSILSRALTPVAALVAVPLALASSPVLAATAARKAVPAKLAVAPIKPAADIIPLPLKPTVPASQRVCSAKAPSGLGSTMLRPASGAKPAAEDFVLVNYIGYIAATGAVFDQGMQAAFPVNGVIPGFSEGLQMLSKGGIARLCIPFALGYGAQGSGPIPPSADLVFQVELLDYKTGAEVAAMRKAQEVAEKAAAAPAPAPTSTTQN
jgi:FKBP-type peptidyl-prolyl cis-trans isomerase FkpA